MKRISILVFVLSLLLAVSVFAGNEIKFSNNLSTLDFNGVTYSRISTKYLYNDTDDNLYYNDLYVDKITVFEDYSGIESYSLYTNEYESIITVNLSFSDGQNYSASYLLNSYLQEYNKMLSKNAEEYVIDFEWPENNIVAVSPSDLAGTKTELNYKDDLYYCDWFPVYAYSSDKTLIVKIGSIITVDTSYYFVDFDEIEYNSSKYFTPAYYNTLPAYKLNDEALIIKLEAAEELYHDDGIGFTMDTGLTSTIGTIFFIALFGILPLVIAAIYILLSLKTSGIYKRMYAIIFGFALSTVILFAIISILIASSS